MEAGVVSATRVGAGGARSERLALMHSAERRISPALMLAHLLGALDAALLLFFVLPKPAGHAEADHLAENLVAIAVYLPLAFAVGMYLGRRHSPSRSAWVREDRDPDPAERSQLLDMPLKCFLMDAGLWTGGAVLFFAINLPTSFDVAVHIGLTVVMAGLTTCAVCYLLLERMLRPVTAMVLAVGPPSRPTRPGVEARLVLGWLLATGVPLLGMLFVGVHGLEPQNDEAALTRSVLVLSAGAFVIGLVVTLVVARSVSHPLAAVSRAQARVQAGDLHASVTVDDASEVGLLQSGFNRMVEGLRERDRVRDLLSRHVGEDVARAAIAEDPELGGEVREIAVFFVDLVGSTELAMRATPQAVVARLNRFFAIVVEVTASHGGWVNKFEGDAALCVFGAPTDQPDHAACALSAARELNARLCAELPDVRAGIGVSAGPAVAGWVGAERRFEYTVIGDPVNQAARLCDLAKRRDERVLASDTILDRAGGDEPARWRAGDVVHLRGRSEPTRVAVPA